MLMLAPTPIAAIASNGGSGLQNLLTADPKEAWVDDATGARELALDFGAAVSIDTLMLGYVANATSATAWRITAGVAGHDEFEVLSTRPLRVPDNGGRLAPITHALWHGNQVTARYVRLYIDQPAGASPLIAGLVLGGDAFVPLYGQEFGAGRGIKDTGTVTRLPSGGIAAVEGKRVGTYNWTLSDLTQAEADRLYDLQKAVGETLRILVVEDASPIAGLLGRIHYGLLTGLKPYERRNTAQVRWAFQMEEWT